MFNYFLILCITLFRPLLGPATCRFFFTCTDFAIDTLQKKPLYKAVPLITHRLLVCNPFTR